MADAAQTETQDQQEAKAARIVRHSRSLASDVRAWVDLKVSLIEIKLWERAKWELFTRGMPGAILLVAVLFMLIGGAIGLGEALGHLAWGFVVVGAALGTLAGLLLLQRKRVE